MSYYIVSGYGQDQSGGASDCQMFCYSLKSEEYDGCRELPAGSKERNECFVQADKNLQTCLGKCGPEKKTTSSGSTVAVAAAIAAAALLLR